MQETSGNWYTLEHHHCNNKNYQRMLSNQWNQGVFSYEIAEFLRFKGYLKNRTEEKWRFALKKCDENTTITDYIDYVRLEGGRRAVNMIKEHKESEFVSFIRAVRQYLKDNQIQGFLQQTTEENLATASAYLLECLNGVEQITRGSLKL